MAGYSGTPLTTKLGIKEEMTLVAPNAPDGFAALLEPLPPGVTWKSQVRPPVDLAVAFFTGRSEVTKRWPALTKAVGPSGTIWVAWPKRSSGVPTDLTEDTFRELLLPTGWVDTKVCAIDDIWTGTKLVWRRSARG